MKLNFVIEISSREDKHYALSVQEYDCNNLYHAFDKYGNPQLGYQVVCVQFVKSKKLAETIARNWNENYERNGTLIKW